MEISVFRSVDNPNPISTIDIDMFLDTIKSGMYCKEVEQVRSAITQGKAKEEIAILKKSIQCVTVSGTFSRRRASDLINHSGFICIDIDDIKDIDEVRANVYADPYLFGGFKSISGNGLALIFRIKPEKHADMFESLQAYLYKQYSIVPDVACRDVSRLRIASFDPDAHINKKAHLFNIPLKKETVRKLPRFIESKNDFERILSIIEEKQVDITFDYHNWVRIGFGIADKYGENGREYFHRISQVSSKYTFDNCDRQYNNCLKGRGTTKATLSTFYYLAKEANITIYSDVTQTIASVATMNKKERICKDESIQGIIKFADIDPSDATPEEIKEIVSQVYDNDINFNSDKSPIEQFEEWLLKNYNLKRNVITRRIECDGEEMTDIIENDIFRKVKKILPKVNSEIITKVVHSNFVPSFNPFTEFYEKYKDRNPSGAIDALFGSVETKTGYNVGCYDFAQYFGRKWIVSVIAASFYQHSPLMLVLAEGPQGIGKTEFFRRMLPAELESYFADSKLDKGKDDEILMTQKLLVFDDEMSGKSKQDIRMLKTITSVREFTLREPYGRHSVRLKRLAVLCGSTNEAEVINDPTGNRRIIPIGTTAIDFEKYNSVDKIDFLIEAYHLYKSGYNYELTKDDVRLLNASTGQFEMTSVERESIAANFAPGQKNEFGIMDPTAKFMTTTQILTALQVSTTIRSFSVYRLGQELKALGFEKIANYLPDLKQSVRGYWVKESSINAVSQESDFTPAQISDASIYINEEAIPHSLSDCPF